MRKISEILRLRWEAGLGLRAIANSCRVSHNTVKQILRRVEAADLHWPLPDNCDETSLEAKLYPQQTQLPLLRPEPDMNWIHRELRRKGVTLKLLWLEYKEQHPDGLQYSQFCERYRQWKQKLDVSLRQVYRAGEKMFVDYAGQTVPIIDPDTGEVREAQIFIAVLGASNYIYAEAQWSQDLFNWIGGHCRAFEFFGGVPEIVVPDNPKIGVKSPCFFEPDLNPTYQEMARYYGCAIIPARVRKPRDKAKVETAVQIAERWILAPLRNRTFFSIGELNAAIVEQRTKVNEKPFQKLEGSRRFLFETLDKPALKPLPPQRYEIAEWKKVVVNIDYHIEVEKNYYSVPYHLVRQKVEVRLTASTVEVLFKGQRVASHQRLHGKKGQFVTDPKHRPASHARYLEWSPSRIIKWAEAVGPNTKELARRILESKPHPEQGYRSCLGLIRLGKYYPVERMEAAARRALACQAFSYRSVKSILETGLDQMPLENQSCVPTIKHENIRGSSYFDQKGVQPC